VFVLDPQGTTDESIQAFASVRGNITKSFSSAGDWRSVDWTKKFGVKREFSEEFVPVLIEVTRGSPNKYEVEKDNGQLVLDRVLHSAVFYPGDYGYVPQTLCGDGDPLDILIVAPAEAGVNQGLDPGIIALCRIVGLMDMEDEGGRDEKVIAVLPDKRFDHIHDLDDIPQHLRNEIKHFFENYKKLEKKNGKQKWARVLGWGNKEAALKVLRESRVLHDKKGGNEVAHHPFVDVQKPPNLLHVQHTFEGAAKGSAEDRCVTCYVNVTKGDLHSYVYRQDTTYRHYKYTLNIPYPGDYGWICQTWNEQVQKPFEILILSTFPMVPESLADARIVGGFKRRYRFEQGMDPVGETKIIGVVLSDPRMKHIKELSDLNPAVVSSLSDFFAESNKVSGCVDYVIEANISAEAAVEEVRGGHASYLQHFPDRCVHNPANLWCLQWDPVSPGSARNYPAVIECPARSSVRYVFDQKTGAMRYISPLATAAHYPGNFGFIPQTIAEHGRPVEVLVMSTVPLISKCVVDIRIIGAAVSQCENGPDTKVIGVPKHEPRMKEWADVADVPGHVKDEIVQFLNGYRDLEESWKFSRFERWYGPDEATKYLQTAYERFFIFVLPMQRMEAQLAAVAAENVELRMQLGGRF
jgi:inorganic pyrophosphatase